jgi:hypothetical protein
MTHTTTIIQDVASAGNAAARFDLLTQAAQIRAENPGPQIVRQAIGKLVQEYEGLLAQPIVTDEERASAQSDLHWLRYVANPDNRVEDYRS